MAPDDEGPDTGEPIRMDLRRWGPLAAIVAVVVVAGLFVLLLLSVF